MSAGNMTDNTINDTVKKSNCKFLRSIIPIVLLFLLFFGLIVGGIIFLFGCNPHISDNCNIYTVTITDYAVNTMICSNQICNRNGRQVLCSDSLCYQSYAIGKFYRLNEHQCNFTIDIKFNSSDIALQKARELFPIGSSSTRIISRLDNCHDPREPDSKYLNAPIVGLVFMLIGASIFIGMWIWIGIVEYKKRLNIIII